MKMIEIWINCPDRETAQNISDALLANHRIACANIHPEVQSSYRWKGSIEKDPEIPLVLKTREENFSLVVDEVREMHPYETPSIIGVPVEFVNRDYLDWVYAETEQ
jgi:periplasmic divalent cation tolerance protein